MYFFFSLFIDFSNKKDKFKFKIHKRKTVYINANPPLLVFLWTYLITIFLLLRTTPTLLSSLLPCDTSIWTLSGSTGASSGALSPLLPCRLDHIPSARFLGSDRDFLWIRCSHPRAYHFENLFDFILHLIKSNELRPIHLAFPQRDFLLICWANFVTFLPYDSVGSRIVPVVILQKDHHFRSRLHLHLSPAPPVFV